MSGLALARATLKGRRWVVARCPFCGKSHSHGAGPRGGNPREFLSSRISHCDVGAKRDVYLLVQDEGEVAP